MAEPLCSIDILWFHTYDKSNLQVLVWNKLFWDMPIRLAQSTLLSILWCLSNIIFMSAEHNFLRHQIVPLHKEAKFSLIAFPPVHIQLEIWILYILGSLRCNLWPYQWHSGIRIAYVYLPGSRKLLVSLILVPPSLTKEKIMDHFTERGIITSCVSRGGNIISLVHLSVCLSVCVVTVEPLDQHY